MNTSRIYISGSITKDLQNAPEKFEAAEKRIKDQWPNVEIVNPMKLPHEPHSTWEQFMAVDIEHLRKCDAIYLLPCWKESQGARLEREIAKREGLTIIEELTVTDRAC